MTKKNSLILFAIIFLVLGICIPTVSMAGDPIEDPNFFKPGTLTNRDVGPIADRANDIIGVIVTVGVVISVVTLCILGIKYMIGSVEEKAEYKKSMVPYIIGAVLLFACSGIVSLIANLVQNTSLGQ